MLRRGASGLLAAAAQALRCRNEISIEQAARYFSSLGAGPLHTHSTQGAGSAAYTSFLIHTHFQLPHAPRSFSSGAEPDDGAAGPSGSALLSSLSGSESPYSVERILYAAQVGELDALAAASADSWFLSRWFQQLLCIVHDTSHAPWWLTIVYTTIGARVLTLPLIVKQQQNTARMTMARPEMEKLKEWFDQEQMRGNRAAIEEYQNRLGEVWKKYDCNPFKSILGVFAQAPLFIGFFSALRAMALHKVPSMTEGGMSWFTDLTIADPYFLLPVASSAIFLLTVELGAADGMQGQDAKLLARMKWIFRGLGVAMVPLTASMPQSVFCYWVTSNFFSLIQSVVFKAPAVRRFLNLPDLAHMQATASGLPVVTPGKPIETFAHPPSQRSKKKQKENAKAA